MAAELVLTGLHHGADLIPEAVWNKIPGHKVPKQDDASNGADSKTERKSSKGSSRSTSHTRDRDRHRHSSGRDRDRNRDRDRHRERDRRKSSASKRDDYYDRQSSDPRRRDDYYDDDEEKSEFSDDEHHPSHRQSEATAYKPKVAFATAGSSSSRGSSVASNQYPPSSFNDQWRRHSVSAGPAPVPATSAYHPSSPYAPAGAIVGASTANPASLQLVRHPTAPTPQQQPSTMSENDPPPRRYDPKNYVPQHEIYGDGKRDSANGSLHGYGPPARAAYYDTEPYGSEGYGRSSRQDSRDDRGSSRHSHHHHHSSKSGRRSSRSRSRLDNLKERFDDSDRGLAAGALGALAGGFAGKKLGKGLLPTAAGVVLGGLAGNALEARDAKHKDRDRDDRDRDPHRYRARSADRSRTGGAPLDSQTQRDLEYYDEKSNARSRSHRRRDDDDDDEDYDRRYSPTREDPRRSSSRRGDDDDSYDGNRRRRKAEKRREQSSHGDEEPDEKDKIVNMFSKLRS